MGSERERHLDKLATAFFEHLEYGRNNSLGLNQAAPFGGWNQITLASLVADHIGLRADGPYGEYTKSQLLYAEALYEDLREHLIRRWEAFTKAGS